MAEFVQTMKNWKRMCRYYDAKYSMQACDHCPLEGCLAIYDEGGDEDYAEKGRKIGEWAEEHQEPVYPTWADWFRQIGVAPRNQSCFHGWLLESIPADLAQKLGLQPKEG